MESLTIALLCVVFTHILLFLFLRRLYTALLGIHVFYIFIIIFIEYSGVVSFLDIDDYLPYLNSFVYCYDNNILLSFIKPHAAFYTFTYPGWLYLLNGDESFISIRLINSCVSLLIAIPLSNIYKQVFKKEIPLVAILISLLWLPFSVRLSGELGRTPISIFTILLSMDFLFRGKVIYSVLGVLVAIYAIALRVPHIVVYIPFVFYLVYDLRHRLNRRSKIIFIPLVWSVFLFSLVLMVSIFYKYSSQQRQFESLEDVSSYSENRGYGNSAYLTSVRITSVSSLTYYIPLHAFYFNYSPMIWDGLTSIRLLPSSIFSTFSLLLLFNFIKKRKKIFYDRKKMRILFMSFLVTICAFGLVTKNAGSAERWRMPITLLYVCILSSSLKGRGSYEHHKK